jgi:putative ABC transport system permease protein
MRRPGRGLLPLLILREWRHHPWRHGVALLAVALGVALAYSVNLINGSALAEFSSAARSASGVPDLSLRGSGDSLDDALFERIAADPGVAVASPVLEIDTYARGRDGRRVAVRVIGLDALSAATLTPELVPRPAPDAARLAFLDPDAVFPNLAARRLLGLLEAGTSGADSSLELQAGPGYQRLQVAGTVAAGGTPLLLMDIAGAQAHFGALGRLSRIDLRLEPGIDRPAWQARMALPAGVSAAAPEAAQDRLADLSRAYRVNLTVLALVALFVGAFLVFSVVSLSVAQRTPSFALLGVLGMAASQRRAWVLAECAVVGVLGSALGLALGAGMAAVALRFLAGDLGGGYFPGIAPSLRVGWVGTLAFGLLGLGSALVGGWWPARQAQAIAPAQALKGLGAPDSRPPAAWPGVLLLAAGALAAGAPPVAGLPLAAYASVAALLFGGVALVPAVVHAMLAAAPAAQGALPLLALQRARFQRRTASAAVAGVVASLALSVALTVMVASFREGVAGWLGRVLPADLYARTAGSSSSAQQAWLPADFAQRAAALPGVQRVQASRLRALQLDPAQPAVTLIARPLANPEADLPLLHPPLPRSRLQPGETAVYVSEAVQALYGVSPGSAMDLPLARMPQGPAATDAGTLRVQARVLGVWRDYARQFGAIAMADSDYRRLSDDPRINDLALWLAPGTDPAALQAALRALLPDPSLLEFASSAELRRLSLRIFDRSFAVTYYLQAVAIAIGLVGIAASLSAQVLARRKEFGLLAHLGLTRRQIVAVVAGEGLAWVGAGALVGLVLGLAVSLVLVFVVNPQSFHWSMDLVVPWGRLALLAAAVVGAGTATAAFSARHAAGRAAVLSVKEDW